MKRTLSIMLCLLFATGGLVALAPTTMAQAAEVKIPDNEGDVVAYPGFKNRAPPQPVDGAQVPTEAIGPADLTGFRVYEETANDLSFELTVADFARPPSPQPSSLYYSICFSWSGTGGLYRFMIQYGYSTAPRTEANAYPEFQQAYLERLDGDCAPYDPFATSTKVSYLLWNFEEHIDDNRLSWRAPRALFEELHPDNVETGVLDPRPMAGDTLSGLQAFAVTAAASVYTTYDTTDTGEFTFQIDTGNDKVKVIVPQSVNAGFGVGGYGTPMYGVEIGSYQTVPVTIENYLDVEIQPNITANILSGQESLWEVRTLDSIPVPPMVGEEPGRATVTLIVNSDQSVDHKTSVRVLVAALDQNQPFLGAQAVDIVAVKPPRVGASTLYFHGTDNTCMFNGRWMNTLQTDATAPAAEIPFHTCDPQAGALGGRTLTDEASYVFRPDVPFARDYSLAAGQPAKVSLFMRSVVRPLPNDATVEVPVNMIADVTVELLEGNTPIGEFTKENVAIGGERTPVDLDVEVLGQILGGNERKVSNDKGLGVRISVAAEARVYEVGGCLQDTCVPEDEFEVPTPGGKIYMALGDSKITLPILSSERSGEVYNITKSGALISMRLAEGVKHVFANPGGIKVFNVTVQNEGVNVDSAKITAVIDQEDWKVEILPTTSYKLKVGQSRSFNVRVTAPTTAVEGDTLRLEVVATSVVDPEAKATLPLDVEVTTGEQFDDDNIDENLQDLDEEKDTPAPGVVGLLAVLGLLGAALRRRRQA